MLTCPNCKIEIDQPQKILSVPGDLNRQMVFTENKVAIYECPICKLKIPKGVGKTKLKIIGASEWEELKKKADEHEDLRAKVQELESKLQSLTIDTLLNHEKKLDSEVGFLRETKLKLEEEIRVAKSNT